MADGEGRGGDDSSQMMGEIEERLVSEVYYIWKKNMSFLYDLVSTHAVEWSSLTVEWLLNCKDPPWKEYFVQKMILRTTPSSRRATMNEPNYLMLVQVQLPLEDAENNDDCANGSGFGYANGKVTRPLKNLAHHVDDLN